MECFDTDHPVVHTETVRRGPYTARSRFGARVNLRIHQECLERKIDGNNLAAITGRSTSYVSRHIHGRSDWSLGDVERMALAWNVEPEKLVSLNDMRVAADTWSPCDVDRFLDRVADRVVERLMERENRMA